jgi:hypothetical protein
LFNVFTDYLSLFVIRRVLIRSGTKPVIGLVLGTASGAAIVYAAILLRAFATLYELCGPALAACFGFFGGGFLDPFFVWPALAVFVWLPLFALGILVARLLTPLSLIVGKTQWLLKEGKEHPLKAIGYVAAVIVFIGTVVGRWVFSAL